MSDDQVNIEIDGLALKARRGAMLIEVADAAGIVIPRFCYHKKLSVAANCRMCLVEVEKAPKPLPACATPVNEGMKVRTRSPLALRAQKSVMEFLLINHPLDCPICDQGGECELQDVAMGYGRDVSRFQERKRVVKDKDIGPLIATDMTRCIHCTRCVRFGEEIGGMPELGATGRGEHMEIGTYIARSVESELSGNVIDLCPVGALTSKPFRFRARAWEMRQRGSLACHDGVGSSVDVHVARGRVMRVVPRENESVNETWLSDRDRFSYEGLYHEQRLASPMIKRDGRWESVDWETALAFTAERLRALIGRAGPQALGVLASPSATVEELYLLQKLARALGSQNIDHRVGESDLADQDGAPACPGLGQALADLERVDAALLVGTWLRKDLPLANHRLRKAALGGAAVTALNPVDFEFNYALAERIVAGPAEMVAALAGIAKALEGRGKKAHPAALDALLSGATAGAREKAVAERLKGAERAAVVLGPLAMAHPQASALRALAAHIGELCGATVGCLGAGANAAGAWLAGAVPHRGPAAEPIDAPGLGAPAMLAERLRGYLLLGVEPELDAADAHAATAALDGAELVVSLTGYRTEVAERYADVLLPIALFAENEGTLVNAEGRWASCEPAVNPPGDARPAWKILRVLGNRLELDGFDHRTAPEVLAELRGRLDAEVPATSGLWESGRVTVAQAADGVQRIGYVPLYAVDPLVRRSAPLQRTHDAGDALLRLGPALAKRLSLGEGDRARVSQGEAAAELEVRVDPRVADGCALLMAGLPGSAALGPRFGTLKVEKLG